MGKDMHRIYLFRNLVEKMKTYVLAALLAFGVLLLTSCYVNYAVLYYIGGILFLGSLLAPAVSRLRPKRRISIQGKAVFISGCDTGFGHILAQRLDDLGFHVFAGCLFPEGVGAESLRKSGSNRLHVIGLDVTSDSSIQKAVTYVEENLGDNVLWAVVNNAGIVGFGEIFSISTESIRKIVDVNTLGVVRLSKAFLLKLKESQGRVVTVASLAGRWPFPYLVPYCVSKTAAIAFCDGLRTEMCKWNIQVITIEPTFYRTPLVNKEELEKSSRLAWTSAPKNLKDLYGQHYVEDKLKEFYGYLKYFLRDPSEVVSVIEEALTTLYPECSYSPGTAGLFFFCWCLNVLPKAFSDTILYVVEDFIHKSKRSVSD